MTLKSRIIHSAYVERGKTVLEVAPENIRVYARSLSMLVPLLTNMVPRKATDLNIWPLLLLLLLPLSTTDDDLEEDDDNFDSVRSRL